MKDWNIEKHKQIRGSKLPNFVYQPTPNQKNTQVRNATELVVIAGVLVTRRRRVFQHRLRRVFFFINMKFLGQGHRLASHHVAQRFGAFKNLRVS